MTSLRNSVRLLTDEIWAMRHPLRYVKQLVRAVRKACGR